MMSVGVCLYTISYCIYSIVDYSTSTMTYHVTILDNFMYLTSKTVVLSVLCQCRIPSAQLPLLLYLDGFMAQLPIEACPCLRRDLKQGIRCVYTETVNETPMCIIIYYYLYL